MQNCIMDELFLKSASSIMTKLTRVVEREMNFPVMQVTLGSELELELEFYCAKCQGK